MLGGKVERDVGGVVAHVNRWCLQRVGAPELPAPVALLAAPSPAGWWRWLTDRLLGRATAALPRPEALPYTRRRPGGPFLCAGCREEHPGSARSRTAAGRCAPCS